MEFRPDRKWRFHPRSSGDEDRINTRRLKDEAGCDRASEMSSIQSKIADVNKKKKKKSGGEQPVSRETPCSSQSEPRTVTSSWLISLHQT